MTRFGVCLPIFQGASARPHHIGFDAVEAYALRAEELGYDSLWAADHLILGGTGGMYEVWTVLSALALRTSRIRLGTLVLCNTHRSPALVAKMAATLDHLSGGRLDLGLGAGWYRSEQLAYGLPWEERPGRRVAMLEEAIQVMGHLFTGERVSFEGRFYRLREAVCQPAPVQRPRPRLWIGGAGERLMLRLVARYADGWNVPSLPVEEYARKLEVIRRHCREVGRDYDAIEKSMETRVMIFDSERDMETVVEWFEAFSRSVAESGEIRPRSETAEELRRQYILGDLETCRRRVRDYVDAGVQHFMIYFLDYPSTAGLERFAREVMPLFR